MQKEAEIETHQAVTYRLVQSVCKEQGLENKVVYGVGCYDSFGTEYVIGDISSNIQKVLNLLKLLRKYDVQPDQFYYIIEDYLADL